MRSGAVGTGLMVAGIRGVLGALCLVLLCSCGHHPPAPVEEQSIAPAKRKLGADGNYHVRTGDTLYAIAFNYGVDPQSVAKWNNILPPYVIHPGQKLRLSAPPAGSRTARPSSGAKTLATRKTAQVSSTTNRNKTTSAQKKPPSKTTTNAARNTAADKPALTKDPASWVWPTNGRVLRGYVAKDSARNGLDIAGREGQSIVATAKGQVVYSGNGLIGYGELIIIKHSDKMLSAYAHNKVRLVQEGAQVSGGQKIAEMGRNAGRETLLHFEIRVHGKPVNPLTYLPNK